MIAAHAASRSALFDPDHFDHFDHLRAMMAEFPQLYADTSALNTPFRSAVFRRILEGDFPERFIHGIDYPVPVGAWYPWLRGVIDS